MLSHSIRHSCNRVASSASHAASFKAFYADFILSILRANPSSRDTKNYMASFGLRPRPPPVTDPTPSQSQITPPLPAHDPHTHLHPQTPPQEDVRPASSLVNAILNPIHRRTALVKIQGPFTDRQLDSVCRGIIYLEKLGLVSVIVVENDDLVRGAEHERDAILEETMRVAHFLESHGGRARPTLGAVVRLGPKPGDDDDDQDARKGEYVPEAHAYPSDLTLIRSALRAGEIPVLPPMALDSFCRSTRVDANDVVAALVRAMSEASPPSSSSSTEPETPPPTTDQVDLTPLRLMIINREGGVPSYARAGLPHLLINLHSEFHHITSTFQPAWRATHPTALANLALARTCLAHMPPSSSAVMVNHRSPSSLIANLITNKPALSSSLPHALLQGSTTSTTTAKARLTPNTPTLLRRGLDIRVLRSPAALDEPKLTRLLEASFARALDAPAFYARLRRHLDFAIVAGDYAGAAIVTREAAGVAYLDKFAVLPAHQGDGTVDFLWVALHDESYGLGLPYAVNPNPGGHQGMGEGRDLVWRSRANNPVNKWYFERASGHFRMGSDWVLFWCDGEKRLQREQGRRGNAGLSFVEDWEKGRIALWKDVVGKIPSAWK
ncbi:mitochondrial amino-acid acetyltransferase [Gloeophyllum trabeum ATCC 11539]|uniref:Amino-acid acetyltransferase, mitochondrial n=1 Tax=Gloeophyllum trabeum (strain ATCC 11539 / FP-39264 / Madison 617) TaxID=670483 RepID=S7QM42_GLOTA|nr:mitochondrial amino-acid acetyltransferase [Gloeophyllum trabeum ATCC 11539]EPQ60518.1 mitochondrial amino-acid acetyltransferase [Gloeophyllum trabeum ATCC 11539]